MFEKIKMFFKPSEGVDATYDSLKAMGSLFGANVMRKLIIRGVKRNYKGKVIKTLKKRGEEPTMERLLYYTPVGLLEYGKEIGLEQEHFEVLAREALGE